MNLSNQKVVLINSSNHTFQTSMPLGLMAIGTTLQQEFQVKVEIHDLPLEINIGSSIQDFVNSLRLDGTVFLGMSTMCNTLPRTLSIAQLVKSMEPKLPIILGGPQATSVATELIQRYDFIDGIAIGESESILHALWHAIIYERNIITSGLIYSPPEKQLLPSTLPSINHATLVDINTVQLVDYSLYPQAKDDTGVPLDIGRGCPYACTFCSAKNFFRRHYRVKKPEIVLEDILRIHKERNVKHFDFVHDMFTANRQLVSSLCQQIIDSNLKIRWGCSTRTDRVDEDLLNLMQGAGCHDIFFGIETGSQQLQKTINKKLNLDDAVNTLRLAWSKGIAVTASLIVGFPFETIDDLAETVNLVFRLRSWRPKLKCVQVHMFAPLAGTELTDEFFNDLLYDGFVTDITSINHLTSWEKQEIQQDRKIFSSFYYIPNPNISRSLYKFLYWIIFYSNRFDETFRFLRNLMKDSLAYNLIEWADTEGDTVFNTLDHRVHRESVPIVRDYLKKFIQKQRFDKEIEVALLDTIEFGFWKNFETLEKPFQHFETIYDYFKVDTLSLENFAQGQCSYIYTLREHQRKLVRLPVKSLLEAHGV